MWSKKLMTALLGAGLFVGGWAAAHIIGPAQAQADLPGKDPNIVALMLGVASVAVDTEAAVMRINGLTDRIAALERRVVQLEAKDKKQKRDPI